MEERSPCGSGGCMTCPFVYNEESEYVQNMGCLPHKTDIIKIRQETGFDWGCHSDPNVLCGGYTKYLLNEGKHLGITPDKHNILDVDLLLSEGVEVPRSDVRLRADLRYVFIIKRHRGRNNIDIPVSLNLFLERVLRAKSSDDYSYLTSFTVWHTYKIIPQEELHGTEKEQSR